MSVTSDSRKAVPLQTKFPRLWLAVQYLIAGFFDRGRYIRKHYSGQKRVLEVGCSVGIDSVHFSDKPCTFLGIDIDQEAINSAMDRYAGKPNMRFMNVDIRTLSPDKYQFDFILICGTIHHISDNDVIPILSHAAKLLDDDGIVVVIDYALQNKPGWLEKLILTLEEGLFVRNQHDFMEMLRTVDDLHIVDCETFKNAAFLLPWPIMAHKFLVKLQKRVNPSQDEQKVGC